MCKGKGKRFGQRLEGVFKRAANDAACAGQTRGEPTPQSCPEQLSAVTCTMLVQSLLPSCSSLALSLSSLQEASQTTRHTQSCLCSSARLCSAWAGSIKIPTIREHFTCLSNSQQRSQRPQQEESEGRREKGQKGESSRRGAEASGVDKRCNKLIVQHSLMLGLRQQLVKRLCSCCYTLLSGRRGMCDWNG